MCAVCEIVEKYPNKGLTDKIYAESFLAYMREESSLEEVIVAAVDKSLLPPPPDSTSAGPLSRVKHLVSLDYIQNNRHHLITSSIFLSLLSLAMIVRAVHFSGMSDIEVVLMLKIDHCHVQTAVTGGW